MVMWAGKVLRANVVDNNSCVDLNDAWFTHGKSHKLIIKMKLIS